MTTSSLTLRPGCAGRLRSGSTRPIRVMLNNYDERRRFDREFIQEIRRIFGGDLFNTHIRTSTRIIEAAARGVAVIEYDNSCGAAQDFEWLSREFLGVAGAKEECKHAAEGRWG